MAKIETYFDCDLKKAVQVQPLNGNVFSLDNNGNRIGVRIFDNGVKTTVTGTVTGRAILADNSTVNLNGGLTTVNGQSVAYVDVPQGALLIPGTIKITIQLTASGVITTLAAILSTVYQTKTDNVITPSAQVIADWNAEISSAIQTQNATIASAIATQDAQISDLKSALDTVVIGKNLCGMNPDFYYPVSFPNAFTYLTLSTSDGSNMQLSQFYLYLYDASLTRIKYITFTQGQSSVTDNLSSSEAAQIKFIRWSREYTYSDLQVEFGQTKTAYEAYWGNPKYQVSEIKDLHDFDKKVNKSFESTSIINIFDNNFDAEGYINPSTGEDASGSSYKRTSKYYHFDPLAKALYLKLSASVSTLVILFYDKNKGFLPPYVSGSGVTSKTIFDIPQGAEYFRMYTVSSYSSDCCVSYTEQYTVVAYDEIFATKQESINESDLSGDMFCNTNMINQDRILERVYMNYVNGNITENVNGYRTTVKIPVEASIQYALSLFNDAGGKMFEFSAISGAFYNGNSFISGFFYSSPGSSAPINCSCTNGSIIFTTPSNTTHLRICVNDYADPLHWQIEKTNGTTYKYYRQMDDAFTGYRIHGLEGKNIAVFGDSIIGNTRDYSCTPSYMSKATGANVMNLGFGGCRMSEHTGNWNLCSMYKIADMIYAEDFSELLSATISGWTGMPGYFPVTARELSNVVDFSKIDAIVIAYGTNDYRDVSTLDNPNDKYDCTTTCGALRYSINKIQSKYPAIKILVSCPIYRFFFEDGSYAYDSDTKDWGSGTLIQYEEAFRNVCKEMKVQFFDAYYESQLSYGTKGYYYPADDGTHPNEYGRKQLGTVIGRALQKLL